MEKVLLVEPEYQNKYPPIGLMKISTYHKAKGDHVEFYKGQAPYTTISRMDRVYITSLFTFHFDLTVETVKHYLKYKDKSNVFLGGIAAMLMPGQFQKETGIVNVIGHQLTDSTVLGYDDSENIDVLPLDYDILDDISYEYPAGDNFFVYATRGCHRGCSFCAVKTLEPEFLDTNHLLSQIQYIRQTFDDKRHVLLLDNNVLYSDKLQAIADDLEQLGFVRDTLNYIPPNQFDSLFHKITRRMVSGSATGALQEKLVDYLEKFRKRIKCERVLSEFERVLQLLRADPDALEALHTHTEYLHDIVEKYRQKKPLQRYVDFNQGIDARLLTEETMECISKLPVRPFRLAYDRVEDTETYQRAFRIAYDHGVRHFSDYLLYNFEEKPEELWQRAYNNMRLYNSLPDVSAFSFPMRYAPIDRTDRSYIGRYWNRKYLSAVTMILNVTNGVVAKEEAFFLRAYGATPEEFLVILAMPNQFIKHRTFFEKNNFIQAWEWEYQKLSAPAKAELIDTLSGIEAPRSSSSELQAVLRFYGITKYQVESGKVRLADIVCAMKGAVKE